VAKLPDTFNFGTVEEMDMEELLLKLSRMYTDLATAINRKPDFVERNTDGQVTDTFLSQGTLNLNSTTLKVQMLTQHLSPTVVTWTQLS
jgi:hypothetical protein